MNCTSYCRYSCFHCRKVTFHNISFKFKDSPSITQPASTSLPETGPTYIDLDNQHGIPISSESSPKQTSTASSSEKGQMPLNNQNQMPLNTFSMINDQNQMSYHSFNQSHNTDLFRLIFLSLRGPIAMGWRPSCVNIFSRTIGPILTKFDMKHL